MIKNDIWISKNKNWRLEIVSGRLKLTHLTTGVTQTPIIHKDKHISYEYIPPTYVHKVVLKYIDGLCTWKRYPQRTELTYPSGKIYNITGRNMILFALYINVEQTRTGGVCKSYIQILERFAD